MITDSFDRQAFELFTVSLTVTEIAEDFGVKNSDVTWVSQPQQEDSVMETDLVRPGHDYYAHASIGRSPGVRRVE